MFTSALQQHTYTCIRVYKASFQTARKGGVETQLVVIILIAHIFGSVQLNFVRLVANPPSISPKGSSQIVLLLVFYLL